MDIKKTNRNKQVRLDDELFARVSVVVERSGLAESDILRLAISAGLQKLESGEYNPFAADPQKKVRISTNTTPPVPTAKYRLNETQASIKKQK